MKKVCGNCQKTFDVNYVPDYPGELPAYCPFCGKPVKYDVSSRQPAPEDTAQKALFKPGFN